MKLTLGAEPKKVAALGGLLLVLVVVWLVNSSQTPESGAPSSAVPNSPKSLPGFPPVAPPPIARRDATPAAKRTGSRQQLRTGVQDFKPKLYDKDNPVDPTKVDPTLAAQVMARLQAVTLAGGGRSLFDFGPVAAAIEVPKGPIIRPAKPKPPFVGPIKPEDPKPEVPAAKPPPPPPPPIPLKFYGFVNAARAGVKRAFFMEGEEIYIAAEGESMKNGKYKLIRIGVNSALVEDVSNKNQQALPLVEEQAGND